MPRRAIDWKKTGKQLLFLRNDNLSLRKYVCRENNYDKGECDGRCDTCKSVSYTHLTLPTILRV